MKFEIKPNDRKKASIQIMIPEVGSFERSSTKDKPTPPFRLIESNAYIVSVSLKY